jgi:hypothetical protein
MPKTRLYTFEHIRNTNYRVIRKVGGFTIPFEISDKINMITGLTTFPFARLGKDLKPVEYDREKRYEKLTYFFLQLNHVFPADKP